MAHDMTPHRLREIAVLSKIDPRTVARYLNHEPVRPRGAKRIEMALKAMNIERPAKTR